MPGPKAILDTSALLCLHHLNLLSNLNLLFSEVRIPRAVEKEFLTNHPHPDERSRRLAFLLNFYELHRSWFVPCDEYGSDLVALYMSEPKMNEGEAEAMAQNQFFDSTYVLVLDETTARKLADRRGMKRGGTLRLLAALSLRFHCCDYFVAVESLKRELNTRFGEDVIQKAHLEEKTRISMGKDAY